MTRRKSTQYAAAPPPQHEGERVARRGSRGSRRSDNWCHRRRRRHGRCDWRRCGNHGGWRAPTAEAGGVPSRLRAQHEQAEAQKQQQFQRAYAACFEGKGYTVK